MRESADLGQTHRGRFARTADAVGGVVHLAGLRAGEVVYLDRIAGHRGVEGVDSVVGAVMPAHCTALGKVLLASLLLDRARATVVRHGLPWWTPGTITSAPVLIEERDVVRSRGLATDRGETVRHVRCVAAPVLGPDGGVEPR